MKRYTEKELQEFSKMGYNISPDGNLTKETYLQRSIKKSENGISEKLSLQKTLSEKVRYSTKVKINKFSSVKRFTRVDNSLEDSVKLRKGLVTTKQPGIVYTMLSDGT